MEESILEVDITKKVQYLMKYGLPGLIIIAVLCAGGIYYYQHQHKYFNVYDAQVASSLVASKARTNGTITELVVADGEHVEAGDVIAHIKSNITDDQLQQLEQNVALSQRNLDEIKKGQTVTVAVPSAAPAPAASSSGGSSASAASAAARMQRMNELFEMGAISAVQRDQAAADYQAAKAAASSSAPAASSPAVTYQTTTQPADPKAVQNAELQLRQAQAALDNAKQDAQQTDIVAPVAGTVYYASDIAEGTVVTAGQTVANVGNADDIWVEAKVKTEQGQKLRLGQFASYEIDGHKLQGSIQDIETAADKAAADKAAQEAADQALGINDNANASSPDAANANANQANSDSNAQSADAQSGTAQSSTATQGNPSPKTTTDTEDADVDDDTMIVKISIPTGLSFDLKPGMKAVVKFALNG